MNFEDNQTPTELNWTCLFWTFEPGDLEPESLQPEPRSSGFDLSKLQNRIYWFWSAHGWVLVNPAWIVHPMHWQDWSRTASHPCQFNKIKIKRLIYLGVFLRGLIFLRVNILGLKMFDGSKLEVGSKFWGLTFFDKSKLLGIKKMGREMFLAG